jgi:hypothetical protein
MRKEDKLGYGYLLVGIGVPPVLDYFFGPKWGLVAALLVLAGGAILLVSAHLHPGKRIAKFIMVGAILGAASIGVMRMIRHKDDPKEHLRPSESKLRITRFERSPYTAKRQVFINVYYRYEAESDARVRGYYKVAVMHFDPTDLRDPLKMRDIENNLWKQFMETGMINPAHGIMVPANSNQWVSLLGPTLTKNQVTELNSAPTGAVLFLGMLRYNDGRADYETDFCAFTKANPEIFFTCDEHNESSFRQRNSEAVLTPAPPTVKTINPKTPKPAVKIEQHGTGNGAVGDSITTGPCSNVQVGGNGNQATVNCGPPPVKLEWMVRDIVPPTQDTDGAPPSPFKYEKEITVRVNAAYTPVSVGVICDSHLEAVNGFLKEVTMAVNEREGIDPDGKRAFVYFEGSPATPHEPLVIHLWSNQPFSVLAVAQAKIKGVND